MAQPTTTSSWVKKSKYGNWGFDRPDPNLFKLIIDLRPKRSQMGYNPTPMTGSSSMSSFLTERQKTRTDEQKDSTEKVKEDNQPPGSPSRNFHYFGNEIGANKYFGGPIIDRNTLRWRETNYTRACGDVIGVKESNILLPPNISNVIGSVAVMSSKIMTQTAIWVGPRLLLSTLHFRHWIRDQPSNEECELVRKMGETFAVESEISLQVLSELSPKVQLVEFSAENDIGLFKLQDHYPPRTEYLDPNRLMEYDEAYISNLVDKRNVACIGYSSKISDKDAIEVMKQAAFHLQRTLPRFIEADQIDLDMVTKPSLKSFAPGTLDKVDGGGSTIRFGVSASLWKGSSGGPCILLDGVGAGVIIGLVRGHELLSDPYNIVNGFPNGLKEIIKNFNNF